MGEGFGEDVAAVGDLDGDGVGDVAIGIPGLDRVRVRSGVDGSPVLFLASQPGSEFGTVVVGLGDVDQDGVPDLGVGAPELGDGRFIVHSGADGSGLLTLVGDRITAAPLGDIDLDGAADFALARSFGNDIDGLVVSGASGETLAFLDELVFGLSADQALLAGGRDLTGDGQPDLVVQDASAGRVRVYDGTKLAAGVVSGSKSWTYTSALRGMDIVDDVDGDGLDDVVIATNEEVLGLSANTATSLLRQVGLSLSQTDFLSLGGFGELASVGDADGDGVGDLVIRHELPIAGATVLSGADGQALRTVLGEDAGLRLDGAGDLDGDGRPDILLSNAPSTFSAIAGEVRALDARVGKAESFGFAYDPSVLFASPELKALGSLVPGGELSLLGWSDDADAGFLLFGLASSAVPLPAGGFVYVAPLVHIEPVTLAEALSDGSLGQWTLPVPDDAAGLTFAVQLVLPTSEGLSLSRGLSVEVGS